MSGQSADGPLASAASTIGRTRSKKYVSSVGSPPTHVDSCDTSGASAPPADAHHARSCSIATGSPVASATSMRSANRPRSGYALCASSSVRWPGRN